MLYKSLFIIDGFHAVFEGYIDRQTHWSTCPLFTKEVFDEIMRIANKEGNDIRYIKDCDAYELFIDNKDTEYYGGKNINGLHLYPIGNCYLLWRDTANYLNERGKMLIRYLRDVYSWLNCEQLHEVYCEISQEIDIYMTNKQVKIFVDGFMAAYKKQKGVK